MTTVKSVFTRIDTNRDSTVSAEEAAAYAKAAGVSGSVMGYDLPTSAGAAFMDKYDADGSGQVSWQEFSAQKDSLLPANNVSDLMSADTDGDGLVSESELKAKIRPSISGLGADTKAAVAAKINIRNMDEDGDGKISREEATALASSIDPSLTASLQSSLQAARMRV